MEPLNAMRDASYSPYTDYRGINLGGYSTGQRYWVRSTLFDLEVLWS